MTSTAVTMARTKVNKAPLIQFVADVSDEQIQVATKAAYAAAVKKAESLVAAVGLKLG